MQSKERNPVKASPKANRVQIFHISAIIIRYAACRPTNIAKITGMRGHKPGQKSG
jgi:hypothetical protein